MKKSREQQNQEGSTFLMRRVKEGIFIAFAAVSVFLFVALVTHNTSDPGWSRATNSQQIVNSSGVVGAWMADLLLAMFGYLAYLFPLVVFFAGLLLFKNYSVKQHRGLIWWLHVIGLLLAVTSACALIDISLQSGGIIGNVLATWLVPKFSTMGCVVFFLAMFMIGVTIGTGASWVRLMEIVGKATLKAIFKLKAFQFKSTAPSFPKARSKERDVFSVREDKHIEPILPLAKPKSLFKPKLEIVSPEPREKPQPIKKLIAKKAGPIGDSKLPDLELLQPAPASDPKKHYSKAALESLSRDVEERLLDFGVEVKVVAVCPGPIITRFEMTLAPGLKVSKITGLAKDLARSLSVTSVRVVEVIPGKAVVGLEIPNKYREIVKLRDVLESTQYQDCEGSLNIALGKDIAGEPVVVNLDRMPHLLVAGTTGSGKSVGVNAMLLSLLYKATPADLRLILIDPKMLELSVYDGIGHLLTPVVTDMNDAANALRWCVAEMERRYQLMAAIGVRNLAGYNAKIVQANASGKPMLDPLWNPQLGGTASKLEKLPYIVVIIDEFADMMMVVGKKVEELIARIAQKARAAGIHMILATQRPSVDVITGLIKANVPTRIAFQVSSRIDSRTILDQQGAEQLLGHGDMLYLAPGTGIPMRVHGAFVSDEEVHAVVNALKQNNPAPEYIEEIASSSLSVPGIDPVGDLGEQDPLYDEAVAIVTETRKASISYLQRRLKIGYNRSARLIEAMESAGVVSETMPNGMREVLAFDVPRK